MAPALRWLVAFFDDVHGPLARTHHVHARHMPLAWIITTDTSPGGPVEYFGAPLTSADLRRLDAVVGDPARNTLWE
eukprot:11826895-Alexandrium_andersonii.AAC.1